MAQDTAELIYRSLEEAIAAEKACAEQLREYARQGDDEEVQRAFAAHAEQAQAYATRLGLRLKQRSRAEASSDSQTPSASEVFPKLERAARTDEERIVQNLVMAYAAESAASVACLALSAVADATQDSETGNLAREIQAQHSEAAQNVFHFLPSRSKIAFNVLTAGEVDPAVETRAVENRVR